MNNRAIASVLAAAALAVPTAAIADSGHDGKQQHTATNVGPAKAKGKKAKKVMFVFRGRFIVPGTIEVVSGNAHVRKGGFVGRQVTFDFASASVVVADTNADQKLDLTDVKDGDRVLVQARALRGTEYAAPAEGETDAAIVARKLIDKTKAPIEDEESAPAP